MSQLIRIFCDIDDFCKSFEPVFNQHLLQSRKRQRQPQLSLSEMMTIITWFHRSTCCTFKDYYIKHVQVHLKTYFPKLVSYSRFIELMPRTVVPLSCYLYSRKGQCTGISKVHPP